MEWSLTGSEGGLGLGGAGGPGEGAGPSGAVLPQQVVQLGWVQLGKLHPQGPPVILRSRTQADTQTDSMSPDPSL